MGWDACSFHHRCLTRTSLLRQLTPNPAVNFESGVVPSAFPATSIEVRFRPLKDKLDDALIRYRE